MALQTIPGGGLWVPVWPYVTTAPNLNTSLLIDATGEKAAFVGSVDTKDGGAKSIRTVGFLLGTVVKAGGSALTVSLQDVATASGPPAVPDETQDQTVAVANADAGFVTNAWYQTGNLSADRSVNHGDQLAVVVEYDGAGRLASDSVILRALGSADGAGQGYSRSALKTGGTWGAVTNIPNVILGFSDGTFGTLLGAFPCSAVGTLAFKQDTAGSDEYALEFSFPFPCKIDAAWFDLTAAAATSDFSLVVYTGTTATTTVSLDGAYYNTTAKIGWQAFAPMTLAANTTYRLAIKPTQTTSTVTINYFDVSAAGHLQAHGGGASFCLGSRLDLGAWAAATTTRRPMMGVRVCACDDGVSTGGMTAPTSVFGAESVFVGA